MNSPYGYCPDPERAQRNIDSFLEYNPGYRDRFSIYEREIALLFSHSQFLANFSISHPERLFISLDNLDLRIRENPLRRELAEMLTLCDDLTEAMQSLRLFKKSKLLHITLRDIVGLQDTQSVLYDLSILAEVILSVSLGFMIERHSQRYGVMENNPITVIGLGKLGARELNYSSDVDLIFVYREETESTGIVSPNGSILNRLSASEYYSKLIEEYTRLLSKITEDGFVYRVDLRLRPQGQKGTVAMSLRAYEEYYESWGQLWERAALLRATPVAGNVALGREFCDMIKPFVFRKYLDTETIRAIRDMKSQVEHIKVDTISRDIKRGYGGIREIEFFIQIFQLIYGGKEPLLRERSTLVSMHRLLEKKLIGHEDFQRLFEGYIFLRRLENRLQELNDLQTHSLPSSENEMLVIARKMGFSDIDQFLSFLGDVRTAVRLIYDSLLESEGEKIELGILDNYFWDAGTPIESLMMQALADTAILDKHRALYCFMKIKNSMSSFQTIRGRRLMEQIIPRFVTQSLDAPNPDRALLHLVDLCQVFATNESYLESVIKKETIVPELIFVLSQSEYLSRIIISRSEYLDTLLMGSIKSPYLYVFNRELAASSNNYSDASAIRVFKKKKEIVLGVGFLAKRVNIETLARVLSHTAEAILQALYARSLSRLTGGDKQAGHISVIAYGKLGGREIIFNSDLDIVFVTASEPSDHETRVCQAILRELMSYTKEGYLYKFDTRLRPDGSKGVLVISIEGLRKYYLETARVWELQALIKSRPVGAPNPLASKFMALREDVLTARGHEATKSEVLSMRERICRELSKETEGSINIKLGRGGIKDIEFTLQYLQLANCRRHPALLCQSAMDALRRLCVLGIINQKEAQDIRGSYLFLRTIEALQRLRNETMLKTEGQGLKETASFFQIKPPEFLKRLNDMRKVNEDFLYRYLG